MTEEKEIDLAQFENSFAYEIKWEPLTKFGDDVERNLINNDRSHIKFMVSATSKWGVFIFNISCGLIVIILWFEAFFGVSSTGLLKAIEHYKTFPFNNTKELVIEGVKLFMHFGVALIFIGSGFSSYRKNSKNITFNKITGYFIVGRKRLNISSIYALQIIEIYLAGSKYSNPVLHTQLNLVLDDKSRIAITIKKFRKELRQDASTLAEFLRVPIWDGARKGKQSLAP